MEGEQRAEMEAVLSYRLMKSGEESAVCDLVIRVFDEFVAAQYSDDGAQEFLKYVEPNALLERSQGDYFVLVAVLRGEIVGMIEVRDYDHISLLFVDKRFQRVGIGRELLRRALDICINHRPRLSRISVNSSPNAVTAYLRMGFRQQEPEQTVNGIRFVPMALELS